MPRFKFRRRSFGAMVRSARPIIRAATGITLAKKVELDAVTIPAESAANYDNPLVVPLLTCLEAQDETLESNGTTIATIPLYSRLIAMRLQFNVLAGAASQGFRWILFKNVDNDTTVTSLANNSGFFHDTNETDAARAMRGLTIAKGFFISNASSNVNRVPIFVRKDAMKRISPFREDDRLTFVIAQNSGTGASLHGFGTLWVKANA